MAKVASSPALDHSPSKRRRMLLSNALEEANHRPSGRVRRQPCSGDLAATAPEAAQDYFENVATVTTGSQLKRHRSILSDSDEEAVPIAKRQRTDRTGRTDDMEVVEPENGIVKMRPPVKAKRLDQRRAHARQKRCVHPRMKGASKTGNDGDGTENFV